MLDEDFNIAEGLIRKVGVGKILRRDKMPPLPADVTAFGAMLAVLTAFFASLAAACELPPRPSANIAASGRGARVSA